MGRKLHCAKKSIGVCETPTPAAPDQIFKAPVRPVELSYGAFLKVVQASPGAITKMRAQRVQRESGVPEGSPLGMG